MEFNTKFTNNEFKGKHSIPFTYKIVYDHEGKILCGISNKYICDLNGNKIASFAYKEISGNNKKNQKVYKTSNGAFKFIGRALFYNDVRVGETKATASRSSVLLLLVTCLLLLVTFGIVALIETPNVGRPIIVLKEGDGSVITLEKKIAVFDDSIAPGSSGEYYFDIQNTNGREMAYSFTVVELYNNKEYNEFPMTYRIKMNNMHFTDTENNPYDWVQSDELHFYDLRIASVSTAQFTLEWYWPYESGNDSLDTYFGNDNGEYSIVIKVTAQFTE